MKDNEKPRLELRGVCKSFPGVQANDDVSFQVPAGKIHALLGENGAGKSTLVKIIYGVMQPELGEILWNGREVRIPSPKVARKMGIGMVFQHFSLFEAMSVRENIAMGLEADVSAADLERRIRTVMTEYDLTLDPDRAVHSLSVGERQRIEIVRALLLSPSLLIMDEPTSVLTPQEVDGLFATLRQLAATGCAILYISHKLKEIKALCDDATILRGGKVAGGCDPRTETPNSMAEMMIGGRLKKLTRADRRETGRPLLDVRDVSVPSVDAFGAPLRNVSLTAHAGEIVGVAGVAGNGQDEMFLMLSGEVAPPETGTLLLDRRDIGALGPNRRRSLGLCAAPEERNGHAAIPEFSLAENTVLTARESQSLVRRGLVRGGAAADYARRVITRFAVKTTGPNAVGSALSGGNMQKFVMGREILQEPSVLVVSQPTWGVDAGAAAAIHQALVDLAAAGSAIVIISQDLDELLDICDTLVVLNAGRLSAPLRVGETSIEEIGLLMGGVDSGDGGSSGGSAVRAAEAAHVA